MTRLASCREVEVIIYFDNLTIKKSLLTIPKNIKNYERYAINEVKKHFNIEEENIEVL